MNIELSTQIKYLYEKDLKSLEDLSYLIRDNNKYNLYIIRTGVTSDEKYEASSKYIKNKTRILREKCPSLNIKEIKIFNLKELKNIFECIKTDDYCVGYIIQEPFEIDKSESKEEYQKIRLEFENSLFERKSDVNIDIDKTTLFSKMKRYKSPDNVSLYPITTRSCINLIEELKITRDKVIAVLGRSEIVTKPLMEYLIHKGYTVVHINSKTQLEDKKGLLSQADCIVLATGCYGVLNLWEYKLKENVFIIDVGINKSPSTNKIVGDLALTTESTEDVQTLVDKPYKWIHNVVAYTPVPGGIGKLTSIGFSYSVIQNLAMMVANNIIKNK